MEYPYGVQFQVIVLDLTIRDSQNRKDSKGDERRTSKKPPVICCERWTGEGRGKGGEREGEG